MKIKPMLLAMTLMAFVAACSDDESFTLSPSKTLTFSVDTVRFDTVFSNVPTTTRSFWVYNHSGDGIKCSTIRLERGNQSGFRVNVDGTYLGQTNGYSTSDVEIRKGDSIRVFVELTSSEQYQADPKEVSDNLLFNLESGVTQTVRLSAYSWDAILLNGLEVKADTTLAPDKPLVIYKGIQVDEGAVMTIAAGTTIYFHNDAGIDVSGTIKSIGTAENPIVLRGDRIDHMFDYLPYDRVPGQWQGIHLDSLSYNNEIVFTDIHSTFDGLMVDSASLDNQKLRLAYSTVHNCQGYGVSLNHVKATLENCQISNTLNDCLYIKDGDVEVNNCTLAQFYPFDSQRGVAIRFVSPLQNLLCRNTLITGYADDEMMGEPGDVFNYQFEDCVIRTPEITTDDSVHFSRVLYEDVKDTLNQGHYQFVEFDTDNLRYDFSIDSTSVCIGRANKSTAMPDDRNAVTRDEEPDVGAFEYVKK